MKKLSAVGILLSLLGLPLVAAADDSTPITTTQSADDCAQARARNKACVIEFGKGEAVEGGVPTGLGENIAIPTKVVFSNLIRVRTDFRDMILKSAEDLP